MTQGYINSLKQIYAFLESYFIQHRIMPTQAEIAGNLFIAPGTARERVTAMKRLGWIATDGRHRSIVLLGIKE